MDIADINSAEKLLGAGQLEDARALLDAILKEDPESFKAQGLLAMTLFKMNLFDESIAIYDRLVFDNPADPTLRMNMGLVLVKAKRFPEAVEQLQIVLDFEPDHKKAQSYLGMALAGVGDYANAQTYFIRCGNMKMAEKMETLLRERSASGAPAPVQDVPPPAPAASSSQEPTSSGNVILEALPTNIPADVPMAAVVSAPDEKPSVSRQPRHDSAKNVRSTVAQPSPADDDDDDDQSIFDEPSRGEGNGSIAAGYASVPSTEKFQQVKGSSVTRFNSHLFNTGNPSKPATNKRKEPLLPTENDNSPYKLDNPLEIRVSGKIHSQITGLIISTGDISFQPFKRKESGSIEKERSGRDQMLTIMGDGTLCINQNGRNFVAIQLSDELAYFQTESIYSFESVLDSEVSCLPIGNSKNMTFAYLKGTGNLLLVLSGPLLTKTITNDICQIPRECIVGWKGRLLPQAPTFPENCQQIADDLELVEFRGSGTILFTLNQMQRYNHGQKP